MVIYKHIDNLKVTAEFSEDKKFRYKLEAIKTDRVDSDTKTVCVIMQNPSNANEKVAYKSVHFIENLIFDKNNKEFENVSKIIVVNQFAYVKTKDFKGGREFLGPENDEYIKSAINEADVILVAWGKSNKYDYRKVSINQMLRLTSNKKMYETISHPSMPSYNNILRDYTI